MEVNIKFQMDRLEGKTMSAEAVEQAVKDEVDGLEVDVEDSRYEASEVEITETARKGKGGVNQDLLAKAIATLAQFHSEAWPVSIDLGDGTYDKAKDRRASLTDEERMLDEAIWHLLHISTPLNVRGQMLLAKERAAKQAKA